MFADADKLPDTYAEWLASAEDLLAQLKRAGIDGERVPLDPDLLRLVRRPGPSARGSGQIAIRQRGRRHQAATPALRLERHGSLDAGAEVAEWSAAASTSGDRQ